MVGNLCWSKIYSNVRKRPRENSGTGQWRQLQRRGSMITSRQVQRRVNANTPSPVSYTTHIHYSTYSTHRILNQRTCKGTSSWFPGTKVQMAWSEPLIQEADPHITKLTIETRMQDKISKVTFKLLSASTITEHQKNSYVPDFNKLPYKLCSQGDKTTFIYLMK